MTVRYRRVSEQVDVEWLAQLGHRRVDDDRDEWVAADWARVPLLEELGLIRILDVMAEQPPQARSDRGAPSRGGREGATSAPPRPGGERRTSGGAVAGRGAGWSS